MSCSPLSGVAAQHEGKSFCEAGGFFFFQWYSRGGTSWPCGPAAVIGE